MQYCDSITLKNAEFYIDKSTRRKFEAAPNRRTVHALVRGEVLAMHAVSIDGEAVRCNPFLFNCFVRKSDEVKAVSADVVSLYSDGRTIVAQGLKVDCTIDTHAGITR